VAIFREAKYKVQIHGIYISEMKEIVCMWIGSGTSVI
jgi:hypothetical protein